MPRNVLVLPSRKPRSLPPVTCTTGGFRFGELAPSTVFAPIAGAGSITMPASAPPTAAAPPNRVRRFITIDSDDWYDLRLLIHPPFQAAAKSARRQFYPNLGLRAAGVLKQCRGQVKSS